MSVVDVYLICVISFCSCTFMSYWLVIFLLPSVFKAPQALKKSCHWVKKGCWSGWREMRRRFLYWRLFHEFVWLTLRSVKVIFSYVSFIKFLVALAKNKTTLVSHWWIFRISKYWNDTEWRCIQTLAGLAKQKPSSLILSLVIRLRSPVSVRL